MGTSAAASPPHQSAAVCLCSLWVVGGANLKPTKVSLEVRLVGKDADGSCGLSIYAQLRTNAFSEGFN